MSLPEQYISFARIILFFSDRGAAAPPRTLMCIPNKQFLEAERCLPFTQTTRRGVEILCIDIKTIDNFTKSIKYLVYTPKCAIIVVFDFSWGDCIKRRKKTGNNGNEKHGGGGGGGKQGA